MGSSILAQTMRRRRLEMGLTKEEAARLAKVSLSTWHTVENAQPDTVFREITLVGVASALKMHIGQVFELAGMDLPQVETPTRDTSRDSHTKIQSSLDKVERNLPLLTPREMAVLAELTDCMLAARVEGPTDEPREERSDDN